MKCSALTLLVGAGLLSAGTFATTPPGEDDVLHATFVAFQEPGIFTARDIQDSREVLAHAARMGNKAARLVIDRQENPDSFTMLASMSQD